MSNSKRRVNSGFVEKFRAILECGDSSPLFARADLSVRKGIDKSMPMKAATSRRTPENFANYEKQTVPSRGQIIQQSHSEPNPNSLALNENIIGIGS